MALSEGGFPRRRPTDEIVLTPYDRIVEDLDAQEDGRSSFVAFLLGGVVVAGGMLAFLYYDTSTLDTRDVMTTGSLSYVERSGTSPNIAVPPPAPPPTSSPTSR